LVLDLGNSTLACNGSQSMNIRCIPSKLPIVIEPREVV
jgi:hypothetical protein